MGLLTPFSVIITSVTLATLVSGQSDACQGSPPLSDRLAAYIHGSNPNNDGVVAGAELQDYLLKHVDANGDACITNTEWLDRLSANGFSTGYASALLRALGGDADRNCSLDVRQAGQYPMPAGRFVNDCINALVSLCENDRTLYTTDCECSQLGDLCGRDPGFKEVVACQLYVTGVFFG